MKNIKKFEDFVNESHDLSYQPEMENARMMKSSAAEFTKFLQRKAMESRPENFKENTINPIQEELTFLEQKFYFESKNSID